MDAASSRCCRRGRARDDRRRTTGSIVDALLWLGKTGAPWRDLPERFGPWRTVATRFYRWTRSGLWERLLAELRRIGGRRGRDRLGGAHGRRHERAGAPLRRRRKRGRLRQALGRSRGGFGSKLHLRCDRRGRPMAFVLTPGERNEQTALPRADAARARSSAPVPAGPSCGRGRSWATGATRGRPVRDYLRRRGISAVIPQLRTEKTPRLMDWGLYRERNVVERLVGRLKEYRRIATRYDKLAASYLAFVQLAAIRMWL